MSYNADYTREYFAIMESLQGDVPGRRAAYDYLQGSTAIVHHQRGGALSFVPRLFDRTDLPTSMKETAETAHRILVKVIERYLADPAYRRAFDFDPRLEELILLPRGYDAVLPFARVDTFLDEDDGRVKFCEFNADGSSGMNENREITTSVAQSEDVRGVREPPPGGGLRAVRERGSTGVPGHLRHLRPPRGEPAHRHLRLPGERRGGRVPHLRRPVPPARRRVRGGRRARACASTARRCATGTARQVDAIWRRCVTNDVIDHWDDSQQLHRRRARRAKVALIGSFAGHIVHDKQLFKRAVRRAHDLAFLDADEISLVEETVPLTAFLDDDHVNLPQIRANTLTSGSSSPPTTTAPTTCTPASSVTQEEWERPHRHASRTAAPGYPFIVQRYIRPFKTETLPPDTGIDALAGRRGALRPPKPYNNLNGLYLYDGEFHGRVQPPGAAAHDLEGQAGHDRRHHLGGPGLTALTPGRTGVRPGNRTGRRDSPGTGCRRGCAGAREGEEDGRWPTR